MVTGRCAIASMRSLRQSWQDVVPAKKMDRLPVGFWRSGAATTCARALDDWVIMIVDLVRVESGDGDVQRNHRQNGRLHVGGKQTFGPEREPEPFISAVVSLRRKTARAGWLAKVGHSRNGNPLQQMPPNLTSLNKGNGPTRHLNRRVDNSLHDGKLMVDFRC